MRFLSFDESKKMDEAVKVHRQTGCVCKNCEYFWPEKTEMIGDWECISGRCSHCDYTSGDNYCWHFRFK